MDKSLQLRKVAPGFHRIVFFFGTALQKNETFLFIFFPFQRLRSLQTILPFDTYMWLAIPAFTIEMSFSWALMYTRKARDSGDTIEQNPKSVFYSTVFNPEQAMRFSTDILVLEV